MSGRRLLLFLIPGVAMALVPAYLGAYSVSGGSEIPTILIGDTVLVNKAAFELRFPYARVSIIKTSLPRRGDMVAVMLPLPGGESLNFKRTMGLPGETIEIRENRVFIDGVALPATTLDPMGFAWVPLARTQLHFESEDGHWIIYSPGAGNHRNQAPVRLAAGQYFLLGDNRDDSLDSRVLGPISASRIAGKVAAVLPTGQRVRR